MLIKQVPGLENFLADYPLMTVRPTSDRWLALAGDFEFNAVHDNSVVHDTYELLISVPFEFPKALPSVLELGRKIPREVGYHVNADGTLCLGSPLRLLIEVEKRPDLIGFTELCLIPYLFSISKKLRDGEPFVFDELKHGAPGLIEDYRDLLSLETEAQVIKALKALTLKKRRANKQPCPCGCGYRLGICKFNKKLRVLRKLGSRRWFNAQHAGILTSQSGMHRSG